jgi:hypothetical protein
MPPEVIRVSAPQLRRMFDEHCAESITAGHLQPILEKSDHPAPLRSGQPFCTQSQYISYRNPAGETVAGVHQYLRPDGTIGGSGRPDPKRLVVGDRVYILEHFPSP